MKGNHLIIEGKLYDTIQIIKIVFYFTKES